MKHDHFQHEHPRRSISLRTRTKLFGTLNLAVALRGRSCGWGTCNHPRRTFVGRNRRGKPDTGLHFIELVVDGASMEQERVIFRFGDNVSEQGESDDK